MPVTTAAPAAKSDARQGNGSDAPKPLIPFRRATHEHTEPAFDVTFTPGGSEIALGPFDVPAHGFIRSVVLYVEGSGGALGGGTLSPDYPWNILSRVQLTDTNGFTLINPLSGYQLYLLNRFGGYRGNPDPQSNGLYTADYVTPKFALRLPVEITPWDGFGSLSNQSASAPFRVSLTGAKASDLVSGGTPTNPAIRVRGYLEAYDPVSSTDMLGNRQETAPPGHGATQFWSVTTPTVSAQRQLIRHTKVGNLIRNLIYVFRDASGVRSATVEPDDFTLQWDGRLVHSGRPTVLHKAEVREMEMTDNPIPTGVLPLSFTHDQDGSLGHENRHLWLPTMESTRLDFDATFGAAGTMEIITNDVAVTALGR